MSPPLRILRLVLSLYPAGFRDRFGDEWLEVVEWRAYQRRDRRHAAVRVLGLVLRDAVRALPVAYAGAVSEFSIRILRRTATVVRKLVPLRFAGSTPEPPRRTHRAPLAESLRSDIRYAIRALIRNPLFTSAAVLSLGLGVGANTAIFSVVNAVLLRPLPYAEPDRLMIVWNEINAGLSRLPLSPAELLALREEDDVFEGIGGIWGTTATLFENDEPTHVSLGLVTSNFFPVLGVGPSLGRRFLPSETGAGEGRGVILSDEFWRQQFGADPGILGQTIRLEGAETVVLGVMPRGFKLMLPPDAGIPARLDVYAPIPWSLAASPPAQHYLRIVARLRPGIDLPRGQASVTAVAARGRETYTELAATGDEFTLVPLHADSVRGLEPVLLALLGGVGLLLLLAAVNVASLLLARTTGRGREFAVRACLGASTPRLIQQLLAESLLLTGLGGVVGLVLGWWGVSILWALRPDGLSRVDAVGLDPIVLGFTLIVAVAAGVIFGFAPLTQLSRLEPGGSLRQGGSAVTRGSQRTRKLVTATEVAIALVLLIGAGLMAQTFARLQRVDVGFDPERLLTFTVSLSLQRFPDDEVRGQLARRLERELAALPGVVAVGGGSHLPFATWANWSQSAPPEGVPESERATFHFDHRAVTANYLESIGARLVSGRFFEEHDDLTQQPVIIVDEVLAARAFPGEDAVGKRLHSTRYVGASFVPTWAVVVGVIEGIRDRSPARSSGGQVYWPYAQSPRWELTYAVRTEGAPSQMVDDVRSQVTGLQRDLAPSNFRVMDDYLATATADTRFTTLLATIFSGMALVLAALGLYSVMAYSTTQRSREIGMRIALGARSKDIFASVLGEGVQLCVLGVGIGLAAAIGLTRFMAALLFDVSPTDPITFGAVALFFLGVALLASYLPARRAMRVDPIESLRAE